MVEGPDTTNFRKYQTGNPVVLRILRRFLERIAEQVAHVDPSSVVDMGCGEGMVIEFLRESSPSFDYVGLDQNEESILEARRRNPGLRFHVADLFDEPPPEAPADLVLCLEVIEHLEDPEEALRRLALWGRTVLVSVPWEPYFRAGNLVRGKYLQRLGNHPEHIQQYGPAGFRQLLRVSLTDVHIHTSFPWLIGIGQSG